MKYKTAINLKNKLKTIGITSAIKCRCYKDDYYVVAIKNTKPILMYRANDIQRFIE